MLVTALPAFYPFSHNVFKGFFFSRGCLKLEMWGEGLNQQAKSCIKIPYFTITSFRKYILIEEKKLKFLYHSLSIDLVQYLSI